MTQRVGVVGAGPSGLSQMWAFQSAAQKGAEIPQIVCFEKQDDWGGLWNYTWRTGLDEYGEPVHSSMYRHMWCNGPKEAFELADYSFEEHFGKQIGSFPPRAVLLDYIQGRAKKTDVRQWIRFRTVVRHVKYDQDSDTFTVVVHDLLNDREYAEEFDFVVVASGHFSTPNVPHFDGFDTFNGRIVHAHDFRDGELFKDNNVLVIGSSYSAEDIGSQCWKSGCKSVTLSYRTKPTGYQWPANWKEVPLLQKIEKNTATFKDGSTAEVDAIILCTGYLHHFPFMEDSCKLRTTNRLAVADLYKGVVWVDNPKLFYIGMQVQWLTLPMFDAQSWYVRDVILGRIKVPDREVRSADVVDRIAREGVSEGDLDAMCYQVSYVKELMVDTDCARIDMDKVIQETMFPWYEYKQQNIMTYRDHAYKSVVTGTMAPLHHTPWIDVMDDSLKCFLQN